MTEVTITDFRNNIKYYSEMVAEEDLLIMNNGKPVMQITSPNKRRIELGRSLRGCVPYPDADVEKIMENKLREL